MGPLQQALVELEESQRSFRAQITEACRILHLDPKVLSNDEGCQKSIAETTGLSDCVGREEWVLRWLLNRLQDRGVMGSQARFDAQAWRLLRILFYRIPLSTTTRILNAHRFLKFLDLSFPTEYEKARDTVPSTVSNPPDRRPVGHAEKENSESSSSSTVVDSPDVLPIRPRKRKRPGSSVGAGASSTGSKLSEDGASAWDRVYAALKVLVTLVEFSKGSFQHPHLARNTYDKEYIKSALRSDPAAAATFVGHSFELILSGLVSCEAPSVPRPDVSQLMEILTAAVDLWHLRSGLVDDVEGSVSNVSIAGYPRWP